MPSGLKIFLGLGQSNMSGSTALAEAPVYEHAAQIWNYRFDGTWQNPAADPLCDITGSLFDVLGGHQNELGPMLSFADRWCRFHPLDQVGLCITAKTGRPISEFARSLDTSTMYGAAKARWEAAAASGTIAGVVYFQGEADCDTIENVDAWYLAFKQLVADLRSDIGDANLPVVAAKIANFTGTNAIENPYFPEMQVVQSRIIVPGVAVVHNDGAILYDEVHLSGTSLQSWGYRAADVMRILGA